MAENKILHVSVAHFTVYVALLFPAYCNKILVVDLESDGTQLESPERRNTLQGKILIDS